MFFYLLLLLTLVPILELALLFRIARAIDWLPTIAIVLVTGAVGAALARREGLKTFARIQNDLSAGRMPADSMLEGVLILVAGVLLITPGVITDVIGLLLLIPPCRRWIGRQLANSFRKHIVVMHHSEMPGHSAPEDEFIDVEVTETRTNDERKILEQHQNDRGDTP